MAASARAAGTSGTDVAIGKTANTTSALVGNTVVFTIGFTNFGSTIANNLTGSDVVPSGFSIFAWNSSGSPSAPVYNPTNGVWTIAAIAAGATDLLTISTTATNSGIYTNTATITSAGNMNNNAASVVVTLTPQTADLMVTKTAGLYDGPLTNQFEPGDVVEFNVTITNLGPGTAYNIAGSDVLPAGFTFDAWGNAGSGYYPQYNSTNGTWTLYELPSGNWGSFSILASAASNGTFTNTAAITSAIDLDPNPNNNTASVVVTVQPSYPPLVLNCSSNIMVTATSSGGAVVFYNLTASGGCSPPPQLNSLPPSGSVFPVGTTTVNATASDNCGNSTSCSFTVTVNPSADLSVTKTGAPAKVTVGQNVTYSIVVSNAGPNTASNVISRDSIPAGTVFVSAMPPGYTYYPSFLRVDTAPFNLAVGSVFTWTVTVQATNAQQIVNAANANGDTPDPNTANNVGWATNSAVNSAADLSVTKTPDKNSIAVSNLVNFTIVVSNAGPTSVTNVQVPDVLGAGWSFAGAIYGGNVNFDFPSKTFTISSLNNGASVTMIYQALAIAAGQLTNTVQVLVPPGVTDPNLTNNTASSVVTSYPVYSLSGYVRGCQTNGPPIPYVNVSLTGSAGGSTLTDTNGSYTFANLPAGTYTVTPSQPGNVFGPASFTLTLSSNTTLTAFAGSISAIRGRVNYGTNGAGVPGIYIQLTGGQSRTVLTDPNGVYSFSNTPPDNYVVTPVTTNGFVFTPTNAAVVISATNCVGQANFTTQARMVLLVALEVNQAIQDWSNSVPLVQNKETVLRAFLQLPNATNAPVLLQNAKLYGTGGGGMLAGSPQTPLNSNGVYLVQTTNAAAGRSNFVNSLNFRLPKEWLSGTINLQLVCTDNITVIPTNVVPANSNVQVTFAPVAAPQVKFYGINWTNRTGAAQSISGATMQNMIDRMKATYPAARVDAQYSTFGPLSRASLQGANSIFGDGTTNAYPDLGKVNSALVLLRALDSLFLPVGNRIYYGAIAGLDYLAMQPGGFTVGMATAIPGPAASGFSPANPYGAAGYNNGLGRHTHSHEIGHDLGLQHDVSGPLFGYSRYVLVAGKWVLTTTAALFANSIGANGACGEIGATNSVYPLFQTLPNGAMAPALGPLNLGVNALVFGVDTMTLDTTNLEPVLSPYQYFDLMSYCRGGLEDRWAGVFTYQTLMGIINGNFTVPPQLPPLGQLHRWLFIRGRIDAVNDVAAFAPFVAIDSAATPPSPPTGNYMLILRDASGNVLNTIWFEPEQGVDDDATDQPAEDQFLIPVPIDPASQPVPIREVQVSDGVNIISDIVASTNFPSISSVTLSASNGGPFTGSGLLNINWLAFDADPNAQLTYTVQYSSAGGTNWQTLAADLTDPDFSVDSLYLKATSQGQIRVIASDGFDSSDPAYSSIFQVANHAPVVTLNAPMNGSLFVGDQQLFLTASVNDPQDGPLDGASVEWTSSLDGALGNGDTLALPADGLSEGIHMITVTATDSLGLTNSASVTIYVLSQPPPNLAIQNANNQVLLSWPASVTNYLLETTTSLMPASWSTVTNVPVAADITQTVTLNLSQTNRFFRLRLP